MLTTESENGAFCDPWPQLKKKIDKDNDPQKKASGQDLSEFHQLLADLSHPKHNLWHGILDPYRVSVYIPSLTTTGIQDKTTGADWTVKSTQTVPEQDKPFDKFVDADDLEIKMLENELAEIESAILLKKSEAKRRRIQDLNGKIAEAKMHLQNLE